MVFSKTLYFWAQKPSPEQMVDAKSSKFLREKWLYYMGHSFLDLDVLILTWWQTWKWSQLISNDIRWVISPFKELINQLQVNHDYKLKVITTLVSIYSSSDHVQEPPSTLLSSYFDNLEIPISKTVKKFFNRKHFSHIHPALSSTYFTFSGLEWKKDLEDQSFGGFREGSCGRISTC